MSVDHAYFVWWTDDEGHPWVRHECKDAVEVYRVPPPWRINDGDLTPSFDCKRCGRHTILYAADRVEQPTHSDRYATVRRSPTNPFTNPAIAVELTMREREALMSRADWNEQIEVYLATPDGTEGALGELRSTTGRPLRRPQLDDLPEFDEPEFDLDPDDEAFTACQEADRG